jgi:hypothetical protein
MRVMQLTFLTEPDLGTFLTDGWNGALVQHYARLLAWGHVAGNLGLDSRVVSDVPDRLD